ncbi:response regulator transcription factor [Candidatus Saccharibacteria bacterium]|nr:response regulator transcription factor [Candidatus Saccharibacteria bacterium]
MRLLIVEDEQKLANSLKKGLEQESYAVDVVYDGDDGMAYATTEEYDLIILDRMLPGDYDGVGILRELRNQDILTPVLFLTAMDKIEDKVEGLNIGADDYLVKPFSFDELLARIKALLRRPKVGLPTILKHGELTIDTTNYSVNRNGKIIDLSKKEFSLLEYMMRNSGMLLTKDTIIQHVWNFDSDILPNTVEVYVGYLRNKIDKPFKDSYIKTKRGFGYIFGTEL